MSDEDFSTPPTHGQLFLGPARVQEEMKMKERERGRGKNNTYPEPLGLEG